MAPLLDAAEGFVDALGSEPADVEAIHDLADHWEGAVRHELHAEPGPWLVAGLFGLLHGLGFAGALAEVGLPQEEIPAALFAFNVGIELGQLAFVLALVVWYALKATMGIRVSEAEENEGIL